jgi:hypothetical protein
MKLKQTVLLFLVSLNFGCASTVGMDVQKVNQESDKLRLEAINLSRKGFNGLAISKVTESIKKARKSGVITINLIEGYDDAGLYYYSIDDYENSARFQSIAVLLSHSADKTSPMNSTYLKRLNWAFEKYKPDFDFSSVKENPVNLLCKNILNLKLNPDIKKVFYRKRSHPKKTFRNNIVLNARWCDA